MARKSSISFLKRWKSRKSVVLCQEPTPQKEKERKISNDVNEIKMSLYFTDLPQKTPIAPIPTPPPSPPRRKMSAIISNRKISDPISPLSTTSSRYDFPAKTILRVSTPPPSPARMSRLSVVANSDAVISESTLDLGIRRSSQGRRTCSPPLSTSTFMTTTTTTSDDMNAAEGRCDDDIEKSRQKIVLLERDNSTKVLLSPPDSPNPCHLSECMERKGSGGLDITMQREKTDNSTGGSDDDGDGGGDGGGDDESGVTCLRCACHLTTSEIDASTATTTSATGTGKDEPIYHLLERPLLCDSCLFKSRRSSHTHNSSSRNGSYKRKSHFEGAPHILLEDREKGDCKKASPTSLTMKKSVSSDYESIPSFEMNDTPHMTSMVTLTPQSNNKRYLGQMIKSNRTVSSDYESIPSFDMGHREMGEHSLSSLKYTKFSGNHTSHDYEVLDDYIKYSKTESESRLTSSLPDRKNLLKIDSHGYASVLPHEVDATWEFDCLNQDRYRSNSDNSGLTGLTVKNVEEAWKHQLERGYAPLTLKNTPPPVFSRTSSDQSVLSKFNPQEYEVPVHVKATMPLPPPPPLTSVTQRRTSLTRQHAMSSNNYDRNSNERPLSHPSTQLDIVAEEKLQHEEEDERAFLDSGIDNSADINNDDILISSRMRTRLMTAPAIAYNSRTSTSFK